jgi:hypothetical protein
LVTGLYAILADVVLIVHVAIVWFVILGLVLTLIGGALGWRWVRGLWFRATHLVVMVIVVLQAWVQQICFLTTWEIWLRAHAGQALVGDSIVSRLLGRFIWIEAPTWVFVTAYTIFGAMVAAAFLLVPPRRRVARSDAVGS